MFTGSGSSGRAFWGAFRVGRLVFGLRFPSVVRDVSLKIFVGFS